MNEDQIRLVLVEDNKIFSDALELLFELRPELDVVATVDNGSDAALAVTEHQPDVVLMDYRLPGLDGAQATRRDPRRLPGDRGRLPDGVRLPPGDRGDPRRRRRCLSHQGRGA